MSPTPGSSTDPLSGLAAQLAGLPMSSDPRGGMQSGFYGETMGGANAKPSLGTNGQPGPDFSSMGPVLALPDEECFKHVDGLVRRQEILAKNRLAQDRYFTTVVAGYPWATLDHDTTRDVYTFDLPYGVSSLSIQPVPNKNLDLLNKAASSILADFPEPDAEPIDDSEEAEDAADLANRFLAMVAGETGTNDPLIFEDRLKRALVTASSYIEGWVDPAGGGYTPLQIQAHPLATDPNNPLIGPDGNPTTDPVLRYITADPSQGGQFTDDPSQAAPQWQPAITASLWERTHLRVFPEDKPVHLAQKVIIMGYCTVTEGRRRWPDSVGQMGPDEINALCDWTPIRFYDLLPPYQRARWKLTDGREKERAGSSDERLFFYFHNYDKASPDYPKGADVVVSGMKGGTILHRALLADPVQVRKGQQRVPEIRCREIPVVQLTPRLDPNGRDPTGMSYIELFVGATENNAKLAMGYAQNVDKTNSAPYATKSTSPISGEDVDNARLTGDFLQILQMDDFPKQLQPPVLPSSFFEMYNLSDEAINSIGNQERASQGSDNSRELSGKALSIAIGRNQIGNTGMQMSFNNAVARWSRVKLELAMAFYETPQMVRYVGEDGAYKQDEFTGIDFALVGKVSIKTGTGTGMPPDQKVQYLGQLYANKMINEDELKEAARPAFSKTLGLAPDPHEQYVERCLEVWRNGPPTPQWEQEYEQWQQAQVQFEQQQQQYQQAMQAYNQWIVWRAMASGGPPPITLGPEGQNEKAMQDYQTASLQLQLAPLQLPRILQFDPTGQAIAPQPPAPPQVQKPWSPFAPRPNDTEPLISAIWLRKMSRIMSSVEYEAASPGMRDDFTRQYTHVRQAAAMGSAAQQPPAQQPGPARGGSLGAPRKPGGNQPTEQAVHREGQESPQKPMAAA